MRVQDQLGNVAVEATTLSAYNTAKLLRGGAPPGTTLGQLTSLLQSP